MVKAIDSKRPIRVLRKANPNNHSIYLENMMVVRLLLEKGAKVCYEKPRCSVTHAARSDDVGLHD
jgi:hypothetical protein